MVQKIPHKVPGVWTRICDFVVRSREEFLMSIRTKRGRRVLEAATTWFLGLVWRCQKTRALGLAESLEPNGTLCDREQNAGTCVVLPGCFVDRAWKAEM